MSLDVDDETSFDDVAMSLLLFFLVLSVFTFASKIYLLKQETKTMPPSAVKTKKTHGDYDLNIHIFQDGKIKVQPIGGLAKLKDDGNVNFKVDATFLEKAEMLFTETSDSSILLKENFVAFMSDIEEKYEKMKRKPKLFLTAHPMAPFGVVFAIKYGLYMVNRNLKPRFMALKLIPCPELKDSGVIEKVFRYNLCIDRRKSQGYCEKKLKLKKKKIKKKFCNIRALTH